MIREYGSVEYPDMQSAVVERRTEELYPVSQIGQSLIRDLLDEEYHVYADIQEVTDMELREIIKTLFAKSGGFPRQHPDSNGVSVNPVDRMRAILTLGYEGAADMLQLSGSNLRTSVYRLRSRIVAANPEVTAVTYHSTQETYQTLGQLSVDYSSIKLDIGEDLFEGATSPADVEWQDSALCAQTDPEAFHPEKGGSTKEAKRVCQACEVKDECLEYALEHNMRFGIWGGLSERERRRLQKSREEASSQDV